MIPDRVKAVLDAHGLAALEFEPDSTPTSPLAAAKIGCAVGQIAKSLLFVGKDGSLFMVVAPGDQRIAQAKLKAVAGVKFRMTRPEETLAATGYPPGGVCPFDISPKIRLFIDAGLGRHQVIYPAAGTTSSGVPMTFPQLVAITGGTVGDFLEDAEGA
ncbi:MAG TPA: YbaK/EbsC family protein [Desulfobacterales bacterium]|nr:YbaK/EbsC family protein [Desulfobacterales bacterium]